MLDEKMTLVQFLGISPIHFNDLKYFDGLCQYQQTKSSTGVDYELPGPTQTNHIFLLLKMVDEKKGS